ncbi:MAG: ABC transporter ATP-binding protein [Spirochaetes bacterium]|nr:ABC transporter ATP-binding protein [Spirochaetota bacterium]
MKDKIQIINLKKSFAEKVILSGVAFTVKEGEIFSIIGKSGTGKSVILKHLIGLLKPDSGEIIVDNIQYTGADEKTRIEIESKYGVLFQGAALFDSMNVFDNVAFGLRRIKTPEAEIKIVVHDMLERVGLRDVDDKFPHELSGGMQKRVGLARSIAMKPEIMLYDEPTTGVDPIVGSAVNDLIVRMRDSFGITSIMVTHDMKSAKKISDKISMLYEGRIIVSGTPDEIKNSDNPYLKQFLEGRSDGPVKAVE